MSRREFTMVEGSSSKFWAITLEGPSHTVEFGRIGTAGQSTRKEFGSDAEAKASHDKLIAEKLKKGYQEGEATATGSAAAPAPSRPKAKPRPKAEEFEVVPEVAPPSAPDPAPEPLEEMPGRSFDLGPADWVFASWRSFIPLPQPEPKPFDPEDAMARLKKVVDSSGQSHSWNWDRARMADNPSPEESAFWVGVLSDLRFNMGGGELLDKARAKLAGRHKLPTIAKLTESLKTAGRLEYPEIAAPIFRHYDLDDCLQAWAKPKTKYDYLLTIAKNTIFDGFRRSIRPYLDADQAQAMRKTVLAHLNLSEAQPGMHDPYPSAWYLAATLDLGDELTALVQSWPDDHYTGRDNYSSMSQRPQWLVLGLGEPKRVESEMRRLKLTLNSAGQVRAWLATTGFDALDVPRDGILACGKREDADSMTEALALAKGPEVAPVMLELMTSSKGPKHARQWLDDHPAFAIAGLIEVAGGRGKLAGAALDFLREQKKKGNGPFLEKCLATAKAEVADRIRREVLDRVEIVAEPIDEASTPKAIRTALAGSAKLKPPAWVTAVDLPKVLIGDRAMTDDQVSGLLAGLARSTLADPSPIVEAVREHADRASLDAFAWAICERWLHEGRRPRRNGPCWPSACSAPTSRR